MSWEYRRAITGARSFILGGKNYRRAAARRCPSAQQRRVEYLEDRLALAVVFDGLPTWVDAGPGPTTGWEHLGMASSDNPVVGAVESLAPHPNNADILYAGTVNGGIWRTTNATSLKPSWTPLTDNLPSLSISALAFSPLDSTFNTLFAGTGAFSAYYALGGPAVGVYRTTDGGSHWSVLGKSVLGNQRIRSVLPTGIGGSLANQVVLVAAIDHGGGLYRSANGGDTFVTVSGTDGSGDALDNDADGATDEAGEINLPFGDVSHLTADPADGQRFYAALPGQGIFRSDNGGQNWRAVNGGIPPAELTGSNRIELTVHYNAGAGTHAVYAAFIGLDTTTIYRSTVQGGAWTAMAPIPVAFIQTDIHFAMLADRNDANAVYIGNTGPQTRLWGSAATGAWVQFAEHDGQAPFHANNSRPHEDARDLVYDAQGEIVEADDGGIYRLVAPSDPVNRRWRSVIGNLRVGEVHSVAYDRASHTIMAGTQDNGSTEQVATGDLAWRAIGADDGGITAVDDSNLAAPLHYSAGNFLGGFRRRTMDLNNNEVDRHPIGLVVAGAHGRTLLQIDNTRLLYPVYTLNAVDPSRMLIGTDFLYESTDRGDNLTAIGGVSDDAPQNPVGAVQAIAYGGRDRGVDAPSVAYVSTSGADLLLRTGPGGEFQPLANYPLNAANPDRVIRDIVLDPDDWRRAFVINSREVFEVRITVDPQGDIVDTWTNLTLNLPTMTNNFQTMAIYKDEVAEALMVGGFGGVYRLLSGGAGPVWSKLGVGLPSVLVTDLQYSQQDDVLVAGTLGRGAWRVFEVHERITVPGAVALLPPPFFGQREWIQLQLDPTQRFVELISDGVLEASLPLDALTTLNIMGGAGDDELIIDTSNGLITVPSGIHFDGGGGLDRVLLQQAGGPAQTSSVQTYLVGRTSPSVNTVRGPTGQQRAFFDNVENVIDVLPANHLLVTPPDMVGGFLDYTAAQAAGRGLVTFSSSSDQVPSLEFAGKANLTLNAAPGTAMIRLHNARAPAGLATIQVIGDPQAAETLVVTADATVNVDAQSQTIHGAGPIPIGYTDITTLTISPTVDLRTPNQNFVGAAFFDLFGRAPDLFDLATWGSRLDQGESRASLAAHLTRSAEYYATNAIQPAYRKFLGREAEQAGLDSWISLMQAGLTDEELEAGFIGSAEYYQHAGGADRLWVQALYHDLANRSADSAGADYWIARLAAGAQRDEVAYGFAASAEREGIAVRGYYRKFLEREAADDEVAYWVTAFGAGATQEDLVAGFVASDEYFARFAWIDTDDEGF